MKFVNDHPTHNHTRKLLSFRQTGFLLKCLATKCFLGNYYLRSVWHILLLACLVSSIEFLQIVLLIITLISNALGMFIREFVINIRNTVQTKRPMAHWLGLICDITVDRTPLGYVSSVHSWLLNSSWGVLLNNVINNIYLAIVSSHIDTEGINPWLTAISCLYPPTVETASSGHTPQLSGLSVWDSKLVCFVRC